VWKWQFGRVYCIELLKRILKNYFAFYSISTNYYENLFCMFWINFWKLFKRERKGKRKMMRWAESDPQASTFADMRPPPSSGPWGLMGPGQPAEPTMNLVEAARASRGGGMWAGCSHHALGAHDGTSPGDSSVVGMPCGLHIYHRLCGEHPPGMNSVAGAHPVARAMTG
jgi:hypothetical protein